MGPRAGLSDLHWRKIACLCLDSNPELSARSLVTIPTASFAGRTGNNAVLLGVRSEVKESTGGGLN